jgi:DMSO/TMAO reductase YedYZ molybdopterin-dependent catalytic subunit/thiosulfate reductase cytochrome b subunit
MIAFDAAHKAVHYPSDRRFRIWIKPSFLMATIFLALAPLVLAWGQATIFGLPYLAPAPEFHASTFVGVHGFPWWLRWAHFFNFVFLMMLVRSGLSILVDHPRLYFNNGCTPDTEWIRFTPLKIPKDRVWRASDDDRYISPLVATPGYRHSVGIARSWHFIDVYGFILTGLIFIPLLFVSGQWERLVPNSWSILPQAWATFVHYANFHFPPEPDGFYAYNALQQIAYFFVVFVFAPISIVAGAAMSPAMVNHFPWFTRIFGGRQGARSIHFLMMLAWVGFLIVHVTLVALTGFQRSMNHIVLGSDNYRPLGMILGFVGIAAVIGSWIAAHYISWKAPRLLQHAQKAVSLPLRLALINRLRPRSHFTKEQISPYFWSNGKPPDREDWKHLERDNFRDYRLKIGGPVENPVELSLPQIQALEEEEHITMHQCIQGWSGIAQWNGVSMKKLAQLVQPKPSARTVAFFSFGEDQYGEPYYDTQSLENVLKPECILAYRMNGNTLPSEHGAPLRLRVENQLGYKMVKWIERIEFIESEKELGKGEGGANEDDEYFDLLPNI